MFPGLSHIRLNFSNANKKNDMRELPFRNGETIKGVVIRKYSERELLVSSRGIEFRANTLASLKEGKTYTFRVNKTGFKTELKVAGTIPQRSGISGPTLTSSSAPRNRLASILMGISKIPHHKGLNDQTGLYINKLRQISPIIIEHDQLLNLTSLREGLGYFFLIPGNPEKGFKHAEVSLENPVNEKGFSFRIALEVTLLGKLDIDVSILGSKLDMHIRMEDTEKVSFIDENIHLLKKGLHDLGFAINSIHCDVKETEAEEDSPFPGEKEQRHMVDILI